MRPPIPQARYDRPIAGVVVVQRGESPSADIYLPARLAAAGVPMRRIDIRHPPAADPRHLFPDGAFVVIVRYVDRAILRALRRRRHALAGVAYLMDDDIPGALFAPGIPRVYALWLAWFWLRFGGAVNALASEVWLTSDGLMARYGGRPGIHRIDPMYLEAQGGDTVSVFYHAGGSHRGDAVWLAEVARRVQAARQDVVFEVFGRTAVARAFRGIPRCRVVHPMTWSAFAAYSAACRFDIGLAPLGSGRFDAARSFSKFYDVTRAGAAGVFAAEGPFAGVVEDGVSGLLRPRDVDAWVEAILSLAADPGRRRALHAAALAAALAVTAREAAHPLFARFRPAERTET